jgi:hypothetical protein
MKKYILSLICLVYSLMNYASVTNFDKVTPLPKPIKVSFSFYIARPALNCEDGFGICHLSFGAGRIGGDGRQVGAEGYIENGQFTVEILKKYTESDLQSTLNRLDYYDLSDDTEIPQLLLEKMGLRDSYTISQGRYRIIKYDEYYEINFDLK